MSSQTQPRRGRQVKTKSVNRSSLIFYGIIAIVLISGAAFLITVALTGGFRSSEVTVSPVNAPVGVTAEGFYYKGSSDAPVKVIKYSDYQCPGCGNYAETLGKVIERTYIDTGKVQFIYHDFPLTMHQNAPKAAEAARCAGAQDPKLYWAMHDVLFARQTEWANLSSPINRFISYADGIGLDKGAFEQCLLDGTYSTIVAQAAQAAIATNITATPTFIIDGQQYNSNQLLTAIEAALTAKGVQ